MGRKGSKDSYHPLESDSEESFEAHLGPIPYYHRANGLVIRHRLSCAFIAGVFAFGLFVSGFVLGSRGPYTLGSQQSSRVTAHGIALVPAPTTTVFDALRALPLVDLWKEYGINSTALDMYPEPFGKKICIVNVDTRGDWEPSGGLDALDHNAWGWLNHYMYAQFHGYDFKFIYASEPEDRHNTWVKVTEMYRLTLQEQYQFVVMTDADVIFPDIRIPLEPLLGHWNITPDIAIAAAVDLPVEESLDMYGNLNLNTGFVITQNTPEFSDLMQDWIDCPTGVTYPNCTHWHYNFFHEQSAFSDYIRYDYPDSVRAIESADADGPDGKFVRHYWHNKTDLPEIVKHGIADRFMPGVLELLANTWDQHHEDLVSISIVKAEPFPPKASSSPPAITVEATVDGASLPSDSEGRAERR